MAEGNGEIPIEEGPGKDSDIGRTPDYCKLIDYGLDPKVIFFILPGNILRPILNLTTE